MLVLVGVLSLPPPRSRSARGFSAYVRFTWGERQGCGGTKDISGASGTGDIRSLDADSNGLYESELNCHWVRYSPPII